MWPELAAGIDELGKLAAELAQRADQVELGGSNQDRTSPLTELLAVLRQARD